MTWLLVSSPGIPSNFRISLGSLRGIGGQNGWYIMGSFVNINKSIKSNVSRKGNCRLMMIVDHIYMACWS